MIRRARRDGREARGNEEREKREDDKGSHCFFKSSDDKLELKHQNFSFFRLIECIIKISCVKQIAKICAIGEQNVLKRILYLRRTKNRSEEKEGMVEREKR